MRLIVDCRETGCINLNGHYVIRNKFGLSSIFTGQECLDIAKKRKLNELVLFSADENKGYSN